MSVVWKFPLPTPEREEFTLDLPEGECLFVPGGLQFQDGRPVLWAQVTPGTLMEVRFVWVMTGGQVPPRATPLGTLQFAGGALVAHLFYCRP